MSRFFSDEAEELEDQTFRRQIRARLLIYAGAPQRVYESREPPAPLPGLRGPGHEAGPTEN